MQLQARLINILPLQKGTSKNGEWKKQDIIVETDDQYPKKICVSIWGDKINESLLKEGNKLDISINIESREYNGKWYTDVKAWKIELVGDNAPQSQEPIESSSNILDNIEDLEGDDALPF